MRFGQNHQSSLGIDVYSDTHRADYLAHGVELAYVPLALDISVFIRYAFCGVARELPIK